MPDDAYGGYRGMWRDAEDELTEVRAEVERLRAAGRAYLRVTGSHPNADDERARLVAALGSTYSADSERMEITDDLVANRN